MIHSIRQRARSLLLAVFGLVFVSLAPNIARADTWFNCTPEAVLEHADRVHVNCTNSIVAGSDTVHLFAIDLLDKERARRFVTYGTAALLGKKSFRVLVPTLSTNNVAGCAALDCRSPTVFGVRE